MAKRNSKKVTKLSVAGSSSAVKPAVNGEASDVASVASPVAAAPLSSIDERLTPAVTPETITTKAPTGGVQVTFALYEPNAKEVWVCGDFNGWATGRIPMKGQPDGKWAAIVALFPGRYEYKFVVDGHWIPDPLARENIWNFHGTLNSVIVVRG